MTGPAVTSTDVILRAGPVIVYGGPGLHPEALRATTVLLYLQQTRVRLFDNAQPTPGTVLDAEVVGYDLDLSRLPRDRTVTVDLADGSRLRVVGQGSGCACSSESMLRGWTPS